MLFGKRALIYAAAFWQALQTVSSQNATGNTMVPACANRCMVDSMFITQCTDTACLCHQKDYQKSLFQCLYSQCDPSKYGFALGHTIATCLSTGAEIYMVAPAAAEEAGGDSAKAILDSREEDYLAGRQDLPEVPGLNLRQDSVNPVQFVSTATLTILTDENLPMTVTSVITSGPSPLGRIGIALHNDNEKDDSPVRPTSFSSAQNEEMADDEPREDSDKTSLAAEPAVEAASANSIASPTPEPSSLPPSSFSTIQITTQNNPSPKPTMPFTGHEKENEGDGAGAATPESTDAVPPWLMDKAAVPADEADQETASPMSGAASSSRVMRDLPSSYAGLVLWVTLVLMQDLWINWGI